MSFLLFFYLLFFGTFCIVSLQLIFFLCLFDDVPFSAFEFLYRACAALSLYCTVFPLSYHIGCIFFHDNCPSIFQNVPRIGSPVLYLVHHISFHLAVFCFSLTTLSSLAHPILSRPVSLQPHPPPPFPSLPVYPLSIPSLLSLFMQLRPPPPLKFSPHHHH